MVIVQACFVTTGAAHNETTATEKCDTSQEQCAALQYAWISQYSNFSAAGQLMYLVRALPLLHLLHLRLERGLCCFRVPRCA